MGEGKFYHEKQNLITQLKGESIKQRLFRKEKNNSKIRCICNYHWSITQLCMLTEVVKWWKS